MDIFKLYYYTSIPLLTCNILFYSITSLSNSITSSQNVFKFIVDHKDCDSIIFKNVMTDLDIENKLKIVESLTYDIIKKFNANNEEFELTKAELKNPQSVLNTSDTLDKNNFTLIESNIYTIVLERIDEPIKIALISTSETVQNIIEIINQIHDKINEYQKSYKKNCLSISSYRTKSLK